MSVSLLSASLQLKCNDGGASDLTFSSKIDGKDAFLIGLLLTALCSGDFVGIVGLKYTCIRLTKSVVFLKASFMTLENVGT